MLNRSLKLACATLIMLAFIIAFAAMHGTETTVPFGATHYIQITQPAEETASYTQVNDAMTTLGEQRRLDIARLVSDRTNPTGRKHLYILSDSGGSFAKNWEKNGYRAFNDEMTYTVHNADEARTLEPGGDYVIGGSADDATALVSTLNGYGYTLFADYDTRAIALSAAFGDGYAGFGFVAVGILLVISLVGVGVLLNFRTLGIERLQGLSARQSYALDARAMGRALGVMLACALAVCALALGIYNHLHFFTRFILWALAVLAAECAVAALAHRALIGVMSRTPIVSAIKGRQTTRHAGASVYLLKTFTAALVVVLMAVAVSGVSAWRKAQATHEQWAGNDLGTIQISQSLDVSLDSPSALHVAQWERSEDAAGRILRALYNPGGGGADVDGAGEIPVLCVNARYLDLTPVEDSDGAPVTAPGDPRALTIAIPEQYRGKETQIEEELTSTMQLLAWNPGETDDAHPAPDYTVRFLPQDARLFTYTSQDTVHQTPQWAENAILVVSANSTEYMGVDAYISYATQARVLSTDCDEANQEVAADPVLSGGVTGVRPVAQATAEAVGQARGNLVTSFISCAVGLLVLAAVTAAFCVSYTRRRGQLVFASYLCGWSFGRVFRGVTVGDFLVLAAVCAGGWAVQRAMFAADASNASIAAFLSSGLFQGLVAGLAALVFAVAFAGLVLGLRAASRRLVTARGSHAA